MANQILMLHLFGGAGLSRDGVPLSGPVVQRRRIGLLALLALSSDRGLSRDKAIGYLWAESPTGRARHLLSESIYVIRGTLGEDAILTGGEELRLNARVVGCDVTDFEASLEIGDFQSALEVYTGPFLDGFFLPQAEDFERWVERERERLRDRAQEATSFLIHRAEATGALDEAVKWARLATVLSDGDESAVRRLIGVLARSGNRSGALRIYEKLTRDLRVEYDLEPSEETRRLINWVREWGGRQRGLESEMTTRAREGPQSALPLSPLVDLPIAVFPFSSHGTPELAYLGNDLPGLIGAGIDGAGGLQAVDAKAGLTRETHVDPHEAARLAGARLYVLGRILAEGGRTLALVSLYDVEGGIEVLKLTADRPAGEMKELAEELALGIVRGVSETPAAHLTRVVAATSTSLGAVRAWLQGERAYRSGSLLDAIDAYERAIRQDPGLCLAQFRIAFILDSFPGRDRRRSAEAIARGLASAIGFSDRDRDLLLGFQARLQGRAEESERIYRRLVDIYPDDVDAWFGLAYVMAFYNPIRGRPFDESAPAFERAIALDPGLLPAQVALAYVTARRGDLEALDFLSELPLVTDTGLLMRASRALIRKDPIALDRWMDALDRAADETVAEAARYAVVLAHDPSGAARVAELLTKPGRSSGAAAMGSALLAFMAMARGRPQAALVHLDRLEARDAWFAGLYRAYFAVLPHVAVDAETLTAHLDAVRGLDPALAPAHPGECLAIAIHDGFAEIAREYVLGLLYARSNDVDRAEQLAHRLAALGQDPDSRSLAEDCSWSVRAWASWWDGRAEQSLELTLRARMEGWNELLLYSPFHSRVLDRYLRGAVMETAGRIREAEGWYASIEEYAAHDAVLLSPALLGLGRVRERMQDAAGAERAYDRLLVLLEDADPDFDTLRKEARRRRSDLRRRS